MMYRIDCEQVTQQWSVTALATNALITGAEDAIFCQGKVVIDKKQAGRRCTMTHDMLVQHNRKALSSYLTIKILQRKRDLMVYK